MKDIDNIDYNDGEQDWGCEVIVDKINLNDWQNSREFTLIEEPHI